MFNNLALVSCPILSSRSLQRDSVTAAADKAKRLAVDSLASIFFSRFPIWDSWRGLCTTVYLWHLNHKCRISRWEGIQERRAKKSPYSCKRRFVHKPFFHKEPICSSRCSHFLGIKHSNRRGQGCGYHYYWLTDVSCFSCSLWASTRKETSSAAPCYWI